MDVLDHGKVVVLMSGGMDSTVLAAHLLKRGVRVRGLAVDYGQRHRKELYAADAVARELGVRLTFADLSGMAHLFSGSSQTSAGIPVPHGHYTDDSMRATVVPNRNMVLLALAGALAVSRGCGGVAFAAHAGDHPIYPDCRPEFADTLGIALKLGTGVNLLRPFIEMTKAQIAKLGSDIGAPLHLTWSCYEGNDNHCGKCGTCVERREAFQLAGVNDPTVWEGVVA